MTNRVTCWRPYRRFVPVGIGVVCALALASAQGASAATAPAPVAVGQMPGFSFPDDGGDAASTEATLYVDPAGTAHVAYVVDSPNSTPSATVDLCTIPLGAEACGDRTALSTDLEAPGFSDDATIDAIKYLPDQNGTADLAVSVTDQGQATPVSETEVFAPGSTAGINTGATSLGTGALTGDEILGPDGTSVDVLGDDAANDYAVTDGGTDGTPVPGVAFQSESLINAGASTAPIYLPNQGQTTPSESPFEVTELPAGQTAVLVYNFTKQTNGAYPVAMAVQPAAGGAFGPLLSLGISGAVVTNYAPSEPSYALDVEDKRQGYDLLGIGPTQPNPMELYQFRGTSLRTVAAVGTAAGTWYPSAWDSVPPTFEDAGGDLYVAWLAQGGDDGCPVTVHSSDSDDDDADSGCLMYRRIGNGGLLGPKIVLSTQPMSDSLEDVNLSAKSISTVVKHLGAIASNAKGVGWVLVARDGSDSPASSHPTGTYTLFAQPLVSSGAVTASSVSGAGVTVNVSCAGAVGDTCALTGQLQQGGAGAAIAVKRSSDKTKPPLVLASSQLTLRGGSKGALRLILNKTGKPLLVRRHQLKLQLLVTQRVGAARAPTTILTKTITVHSRR
jgi:hypothetical protein